MYDDDDDYSDVHEINAATLLAVRHLIFGWYFITNF